jgi:hypothetical protein
METMQTVWTWYNTQWTYSPMEEGCTRFFQQVTGYFSRGGDGVLLRLGGNNEQKKSKKHHSEAASIVAAGFNRSFEAKITFHNHSPTSQVLIRQEPWSIPEQRWISDWNKQAAPWAGGVSVRNRGSWFVFGHGLKMMIVRLGCYTWQQFSN